MDVTRVRVPAVGWPVRSASASMLAGLRSRAEALVGGRAAGRVEAGLPGIGLVLHTPPRPVPPRAPRSASGSAPDIRRCAHVRLDVRVSVPRMVALAGAPSGGSSGSPSAGPGRLPAPVLRTAFAGPGRAVAERGRVTRELYEHGAGHGRRIEEAGRPGATPRDARPAAPPGRAGGPRGGLTLTLPGRPAPVSTAAERRPAPAEASVRGRVEPAHGHGATAPALTSADLPRLVDGVVREIDRRVLARRERRGWSR
ncbi:hypothetical protein [Embleya scabrispora]|uniref:hypothetical protein n=1 Tax=Embleya scabrispora TaxID=159449 RepID=UPI0003A00BD7|nr:hypothetical protein [Embleya scabrispora]MYS85053.1 hypothetical protein [Streptomyces sp. SID5474]